MSNATMKQVLLSLCMLLLSVTGNTASAASKFTGIMAMIMKMPNGSAEITYYFGNDRRSPTPMELFLALIGVALARLCK